MRHNTVSSSLHPTEPRHRVEIEGSVSLSFSDRRATLEMADIFLNRFQNGGYNGMVYSAIHYLKYTPHKT